MYIFIHKCTYTPVQIYIFMYVCTYLHLYVHTYVYIYICILHIHTHIHAYTASAHTYIHIYSHPSFSSSRRPSTLQPLSLMYQLDFSRTLSCRTSLLYGSLSPPPSIGSKQVCKYFSSWNCTA